MRSAILSAVLVICLVTGVGLAQPRPRPLAPAPVIPPTAPAAGTAVAPAAVPAAPPAAPDTSVPVVGQVTDIPSAEPVDAMPATRDDQVDAPIPGAWCDVYISQRTVRDIAVVDQTGTYMPEVREVNIWIQVATRQPQVRLTSWPGLYRPADPAAVQQQDLRVRKIITVPDAEFRKLVTTKPVAAGKPE